MRQFKLYHCRKRYHTSADKLGYVRYKLVQDTILFYLKNTECFFFTKNSKGKGKKNLRVKQIHSTDIEVILLQMLHKVFEHRYMCKNLYLAYNHTT